MGRAILALTLAVMLAGGIIACGGSSTSDSATTAAPAATTAAPEPAASETADAGGPATSEVAQLYADNCSGCHGADGAGGSAKGIAGEDDAAGVQRWIEQGGEGMPGYADQMPPGQIQALAEYVAAGLQ
jgi:mono/diheme cytochrome c family protein